MVGDDAGKVGFGTQGGHVVDELGAQLQRAARDLGLRSVDRDGYVALEPFQHRDDAAKLLVRADRLGAGPRRLAADVHDRRPFVEHPPRRGDSVVRVEVHPAVRERVGRDVDDAHHGRSGKALL